MSGAALLLTQTDLNGHLRSQLVRRSAIKALAVDKPVFAIMSGPQTKTTHSPEPQPRGMSTIEPVGSLRALALFWHSPHVLTSGQGGALAETM